MRGSLVQRYKGSWSVVLDLGYDVDPATGTKKRRQKWITVRGTRRDAEAELAKHVNDVHHGDFIRPNKMTFGQWLDEWVEKAIKPPAKAPSTYEHYRGVIARHLKPKLVMIPLQQLRSTDLKRAYLDAAQGDAMKEAEQDGRAVARGRWGRRKALTPGTLAFHHNIASAALQAAVLEGLVQKNVAKLVVGKPRQRNDGRDVLEHCWTSPEAKAFLLTAKSSSPQAAAFYALALDSGMRRNELAGLRWADLDLANARVRIERQLRMSGPSPVFGPTKNKMPRTIDIIAEMVTLLRQHRGQQAEMKLGNGDAYRDLGLVFAKEPVDRRRPTRSATRSRSTTSIANSRSSRTRQACARSSFTGCATPARRCSFRPAYRRTSCSSALGTGASRSRSASTRTRSRPCSRTLRRGWRRCCTELWR